MGAGLCYRLRHRLTYPIIMISGFLCFTLYTLTLSCCAVPLDTEGLQRGARVVLQDGDEGRYQRDLENYKAPRYNRLVQKKLLDHQDNVIYSDDFTDILPNVDSDEVYHAGRPRSEDSNSDKLYYEPVENRKSKHSRTNVGPVISVRSQENGTKKLPDALIIGVKKGGTRALLEFIRVHPDVRAPGPETHFFDRNYENGIEWYRDQMPPTLDGQMTMEKTPSYFVTKGVPGRIYNMSKNIKLIVVVRDPVTRAISDYTQTISKRSGLKSFEEMAFLNNSAGLVDTSWGAIKIGVYAKHLEKWLKYFPLSQIHFVNGETLITNPAGEMAKVQDFLGLKRVISDKHFYFNATKGFPCLKKPEGSGSPHCLGKTKGRTHPKVGDKVIQRLRDFYRPFNAKFYQMTGIDFDWP